MHHKYCSNAESDSAAHISPRSVYQAIYSRNQKKILMKVHSTIYIVPVQCNYKYVIILGLALSVLVKVFCSVIALDHYFTYCVIQ